MKKLALAAAVALLAPLGAVTTTANAADPYPGFVPTNCRIKVDHNGGKRNVPRILTLVEVPSSRAHPKGQIHVVVKKKGGTVIFDQVFSGDTGKTLKFFAPKWARSTRYNAKITFTPFTGTVYDGCSRQATFKPAKKPSKS